MLGHLIDSACNNHQRFIRLQQSKEVSFPVYEPNEWVDRGGYNDVTWQLLIDLWANYARVLAALVERVPENLMANRWKEMGLTLKLIADDNVVHMNHHLKQIVEDR